ncbi:MAG: hypothetical protein WAT34_07270 [Chitinophagaceae bacterium]
MENKFINRDFEEFVKQNADQYRMFPSEKVWNNIHHSLHTRRRWYGIGLTLLLISTAAVTGIMLSNAGKKQPLANSSANHKTLKPTPEIKIPEIIIVQTKPVNDKISFVTTPEKFQKNLFSASATYPLKEDEIVNSAGDPSLNYPEPVTLSSITIRPGSVSKSVAVSYSKQNNMQVKPVQNYQASPKAKNSNNPTSPNTSLVETKKIEAPANTDREVGLIKNDIYPLTIESIVNSYKHIRQRKKLSWQVYFTPTVSYRRLKENKGFLDGTRPYTSSVTNNSFSDINSIVTHKPDIGLQLGFTTGYPLSKKIRITGGLQFTVSKYDILAFTYPSEVVTIALSTSAGGSNSVSTYTNYRNSGGSSHANWLRNLYISASAPVGLEFKIAGNKKSYYGVSGTVQPTFNLSNRAYLISTDYKNYAEVPSLVRKWNINTGFEIFAGYTTGKINWRISPQVRYQTLSSFQEKYPVKEHLFDFGLKLGLMLK